MALCGSEASCLVMKGCSALELHNSLGNVAGDQGYKTGTLNNHSSMKACEAGRADVPVAGSGNGKVEKVVCNQAALEMC